MAIHFCFSLLHWTLCNNAHGRSISFFATQIQEFLRHRRLWIAQWLERRTRDRNVAGSNPWRSGRRIFFSSVNFLCWLLFWYPFHTRVQVARKRPRSFCQKCRWQVIVKNMHAPYVCGFAWSGMVHGCMVYTERAETAAVSCGTSHAGAVSTPLRWVFKNAL